MNVIPNKDYYGVIVCLESTHPASLASVLWYLKKCLAPWDSLDICLPFKHTIIRAGGCFGG